ncbi:MAG: XkdQ/YqbQ family protein [Bacillota bacterium]|jgi:hypothetical protein
MNEYRLLWNWYKNDIYSLNYTELRWYSYYRGQAGRLEFSCLWGDTFSNRPDLQPGQMVTLWCGSTPVFRGYIFEVDYENGRYKVVCYDQTRYLLNKDSRIFYKQKASDIVKSILNCCGLPMGSMAEVAYTIPLLSFEGTAYLDMIGTALHEAEKRLNKRYVLYDKHGLLTLTALQNTALNIKLTGENAVFAADCKVSIDEEVYTEAKLTQYAVDNPGHRSYTAVSYSNAAKYGRLRYYQQVDKDYNSAQVQSLAKSILAYHSSPKQAIYLSALGDINCRAGFRPYIYLPQIGIDGSYLIRSAEHIISGDTGHIMNLECVK